MIFADLLIGLKKHPDARVCSVNWALADSEATPERGATNGTYEKLATSNLTHATPGCFNTSSAMAHHRAKQDIGCVKADSNFENRNIEICLVTFT